MSPSRRQVESRSRLSCLDSAADNLHYVQSGSLSATQCCIRFLPVFWTVALIADEGTSYHLTRQHTQNYVQAIQQISRLLHDVVIWELDQEGLECQCICPSCGIGICLCAMAGRSFLSDTWVEAGPIADDEGVYVQLPKQNSAAAKAGLRRGNVIISRWWSRNRVVWRSPECCAERRTGRRNPS